MAQELQFVKSETHDGLSLQGLFAEAEPRIEAILHIHGMAGNFWENSFIKTMISEYPKAGLSFLSAELRGSEVLRTFPFRQDRSPDGMGVLIGNALEKFEESVFDIAAWIEFIAKKGYKRIYLQGHSLGCSKIVYFQTQHPSPLVSALLCISPSDMIGLVLEPKMIEQHKRLTIEATELVRIGKGKTLLSEPLWGAYPLSGNTYLNFFGEGAKTAIFNYFSPELGFNVVSRIECPLLSIIGGEDDGVVTNKAEANALLAKNAKSSPRFSGHVISHAPHSFAGFESDVVKLVLEFLRE